jgi:putative transposase
VLDTEIFTSVAEAQLVADDWRETYNNLHPHSALGMLAPSVFAERCGPPTIASRP